ncbi:MAG: hypothetical protein J6U01_03485 [Clostridia bacterium]|nr:hypothetical protein [Clostridia bacterium]
MKAVIHLDVPEWQIGQEVTVYFPDTMQKNGTCEQECKGCSTVFDVAYKAGKESIVRCKDCKYWSAERINDFNKCRRWINVGVKNFATMGDWFCADGEKAET